MFEFIDIPQIRCNPGHYFNIVRLVAYPEFSLSNIVVISELK